MLKQRMITAAILIPVFLTLLLWAPALYVSALLLLVMLMGGWEWGRLLRLSNIKNIVYLLLLAAACLGSIYADISLAGYAVIFWVGVVTLLAWIHARAYWIERFKSWQENFSFLWKVLAGTTGAMVLVPCWVSLLELMQQAHGRGLMLSLFLLVWTADIAAYFCGKAWGKHKLSVVLSPGKSREGVLGGSVAVLLFGFFLVVFLLPFHVGSVPGFIALCAMISVISVVGDLFQSLLKRITGVKDSGQLLPGHGGILDRIDSITAAAPVFVFGLSVLEVMP